MELPYSRRVVETWFPDYINLALKFLNSNPGQHSGEAYLERAVQCSRWGALSLGYLLKTRGPVTAL